MDRDTYDKYNILSWVFFFVGAALIAAGAVLMIILQDPIIAVRIILYACIIAGIILGSIGISIGIHIMSFK